MKYELKKANQFPKSPTEFLLISRFKKSVPCHTSALKVNRYFFIPSPCWQREDKTNPVIYMQSVPTLLEAFEPVQTFCVLAPPLRSTAP